jgi:hypothetical protein
VDFLTVEWGIRSLHREKSFTDDENMRTTNNYHREKSFRDDAKLQFTNGF